MSFFKSKNSNKDVRTHYLIDLENVQTEGFIGCDKLSEDALIHIFYTDNSKKIDLDVVALLGNAKVELHKVSAGKQSLDMHLISYLGYLIGANEGKNVSFVIISKDTDYDNAVTFWKEQKNAEVQRRRRIDPNYVEEKPKVNSGQRYSGGYKKNNNRRYNGNSNRNNNNKPVEKPEPVNVKEEPVTEPVKIEPKPEPKVEPKPKTEPKPKAEPKSKEANPDAIMKALEAAGFANGEADYINNLIKNHEGDGSRKQMVYRAVISKYKQENGLKIYNAVKKYI